MALFSLDDLRELQAESLETKIQISLAKIGEWYDRMQGNVYVAFSGGKDSTMLADLAAKWCQISDKPWKLTLCFLNTGLEYPEVRDFVTSFADWLREKYQMPVELIMLNPSMPFRETLTRYGYPLISKSIAKKINAGQRGQAWALRYLSGDISKTEKGRSKFDASKYAPLVQCDFRISNYCCKAMKENALARYERETGERPMIATLADEGLLRQSQWLQKGCNVYDSESPKSKPLSVWKENDILLYIKKYNLPLLSLYGDIVPKDDPDQIMIDSFFSEDTVLTTTGISRTGCIFCGFGAHIEKGVSRFQKLKTSHPKLYTYCIGGGAYDSDGLWKPSKEGLGMGHVFDAVNRIYGEDFIRYK